MPSDTPRRTLLSTLLSAESQVYYNRASAVSCPTNTISKCLSHITSFHGMFSDAAQTKSLFYIKRGLLTEMV